MQPLIDADILVYEAACAAEIGWKSGGVAPWDYVEGLLEGTLVTINAAVRATDAPLMFLSSDNNFRYALAITKPYKGNRKHAERPFHYDNIRAYVQARWETILCDGYEADDGLAIAQTKAMKEGRETIICSRDKDLRQVNGWHYTWARGQQEEDGPVYVDGLGELSISSREVVPSNPDKRPYIKYKLRGTGMLFFYAQCLMGDPTDNIPGLKGCADLGAWKILEGASSEEECHKRVLEAYNSMYGNENGMHMLTEQARLVWMVRELDENNNPVMWEAPINIET